MNKRLIKKFEKEFKHYLNDGSVLCLGSGKTQWFENEDPNNHWNSWFPLEFIQKVIINDEYVEFRKAIAEGKTIQCWLISEEMENHNDDVYTWQDLSIAVNNPSRSFSSSHKYRVKPEKYTIKKGRFSINFPLNFEFYQSSVYLRITSDIIKSTIKINQLLEDLELKFGDCESDIMESCVSWDETTKCFTVYNGSSDISVIGASYTTERVATEACKILNNKEFDIGWIN